MEPSDELDMIVFLTPYNLLFCISFAWKHLLSPYIKFVKPSFSKNKYFPFALMTKTSEKEKVRFSSIYRKISFLMRNKYCLEFSFSSRNGICGSIYFRIIIVLKLTSQTDKCSSEEHFKRKIQTWTREYFHLAEPFAHLWP